MMIIRMHPNADRAPSRGGHAQRAPLEAKFHKRVDLRTLLSCGNEAFLCEPNVLRVAHKNNKMLKQISKNVLVTIIVLLIKTANSFPMAYQIFEPVWLLARPYVSTSCRCARWSNKIKKEYSYFHRNLCRCWWSQATRVRCKQQAQKWSKSRDCASDFMNVNTIGWLYKLLRACVDDEAALEKY